MSMLKTMNSLLSKVFVSSAWKTSQRLSYRPLVEGLEERAVPTAFTWTDATRDGLWTTRGNWTPDPGAGNYPGSNANATPAQIDSVTFTNSNNDNCTLNLGTSGSVTIASLASTTYTGTLTIGANATLNIEATNGGGTAFDQLGTTHPASSWQGGNIALQSSGSNAAGLNIFGVNFIWSPTAAGNSIIGAAGTALSIFPRASLIINGTAGTLGVPNITAESYSEGGGISGGLLAIAPTNNNETLASGTVITIQGSTNSFTSTASPASLIVGDTNLLAINGGNGGISAADATAYIMNLGIATFCASGGELGMNVPFQNLGTGTSLLDCNVNFTGSTLSGVQPTGQSDGYGNVPDFVNNGSVIMEGNFTLQCSNEYYQVDSTAITELGNANQGTTVTLQAPTVVFNGGTLWVNLACEGDVKGTNISINCVMNVCTDANQNVGYLTICGLNSVSYGTASELCLDGQYAANGTDLGVIFYTSGGNSLTGLAYIEYTGDGRQQWQAWSNGGAGWYSIDAVTGPLPPS
jgi:hypothetical protein